LYVSHRLSKLDEIAKQANTQSCKVRETGGWFAESCQRAGGSFDLFTVWGGGIGEGPAECDDPSL